MRWYVMQTKTGGEEKLTGMIRRMIPRQLYDECFVVYFEQLWRRQQKALVHVERAFPGYVFITSEAPNELYMSLKRVPAMSKLVSDDNFYFLPLDREEEAYLKQIMNEQHVIRLSYLSTDGHGHVFQVSGPLECCLENVVRYNYRKRYAAVRLSLAGAEKQVMLGIILNEDIRRELLYGKVEAPIPLSEQYQVPQPARELRPEERQRSERKAGAKQRPGSEQELKSEQGKGLKQEPGSEQGLAGETRHGGAAAFAPGDSVRVILGELAGITGTVCRVKKHTVRIQLHFLGRQLEMEIPAENLRKTA